MIGLKNSQGNTNERKKKELQIPHWDYKGSESYDIVWISQKILTFQSAAWTLQFAVIFMPFLGKGMQVWGRCHEKARDKMPKGRSAKRKKKAY